MKRELLPPEALSGDSVEFFDTLNKEGDLAVVLVAASYLDACVGTLLGRFFIESGVSNKLLDINGALGSFGARADASYALDLISTVLYQDLLTVVEMRNRFAHHHLALDFEDVTVRQLCGKLKWVESLRNGATKDPLGLEKFMVTTRDRFVLTVVMLSQSLLLDALSVKRQGSGKSHGTAQVESPPIPGAPHV
jgi:DNA-binding MltR family transcriptional regulator